MSSWRDDTLELLKGLSEAELEELIFRLHMDAIVPGKPASRIERAIELVKATESRGAETQERFKNFLLDRRSQIVPGGANRSDEPKKNYEFFLSYAHKDHDDYLHQFLKDLTNRVCSELDIQDDDRVGFFAGRDIGLGDHPDSQILHALRSSKVMVCLYSEEYFRQSHCGKEWSFFHLRRKAAQKVYGHLPPVILPVLWKPPTPSNSRESNIPDLPEAIDSAVTEIKYTLGAEQKVYNVEGLRFALCQKRNYQADYADYVSRLAGRIVQAGKGHPLPNISEVTSLAEIAPAFPFRTIDSGSAVPKPAPGPRHVRFVIVAANPHVFGDARDPSAYLETGGGDWKPFLPEQAEELGPYVQNIVSSKDLRFTSDICLFSKELRTEVESAWIDRKLVVILVDGWTMYWDSNAQRVLRELANEERFRNCTFLVPWNGKDPEIAKHGLAIDKLLRRTFQSRFAMGSAYFRDNIRSLDELKSALIKTIIDLKSEIYKAETSRPVPQAGPVPIVSATGGKP